VPFEFGRGQQLPAPIIRNKLLYFLSLDRDQFKPDSPLMQSKMCASDFVALRLVYEAMRAEPYALRELLDRVDSVPWKQGEAAKPGSGPWVVQIVYESPTPAMVEGQKRIDERAKTRGEKMLDAVKRLPAAQDDSSQITYIETEPGSAE